MGADSGGPAPLGSRAAQNSSRTAFFGQRNEQKRENCQRDFQHEIRLPKLSPRLSLARPSSAWQRLAAHSTRSAVFPFVFVGFCGFAACLQGFSQVVEKRPESDF
jgi:hypothetical protein